MRGMFSDVYALFKFVPPNILHLGVLKMQKEGEFAMWSVKRISPTKGACQEYVRRWYMRVDLYFVVAFTTFSQ